jgi:hypothetical protein
MFKKRAPGTLLLLYYAEKLHGRSVFGYVAIGHLHLLLAGKAVISISCGTIRTKSTRFYFQLTLLFAVDTLVV